MSENERAQGRKDFEMHLSKVYKQLEALKVLVKEKEKLETEVCTVYEASEKRSSYQDPIIELSKKLTDSVHSLISNGVRS